MNIVEAIRNRDFITAKKLFNEHMDAIVYDTVNEMRKTIAEEFVLDESEELLAEAGTRIRIIKARVRNGKIQRRKKISNAAGYRMQGGILKRMSPAERRRRKLGQRSGKIKRRQKLTIALKKRKRSLMRRRAFGG